jgi:hypothetical protein
MIAAAIAVASMPASRASEPAPGSENRRAPITAPGSDASPGIRWFEDSYAPWLQSGGDGGSPWPTLVISSGECLPHSARLGDARLYAHTRWDGRDYEIRLVRLTADGGSNVFDLTSNRKDDVRPRLSGLSDGPPLVIWERRTRTGFDLLSTLIAPDGTPASPPVPLGHFGPETVDATAVLLPHGLPLVATARRGARDIVVEVHVGHRAPVPIGTAPAGSEITLRVVGDASEGPRILWSGDGDTTVSVSGDVRGRWSAPRYERRPRR